MTRMKAVVGAALLVLVLSTAGIAGAITYGELDGDGHPYVGIIVIEDTAGDRWSCSGTLLSDTVFLTAGHCTFDMVNAWVSFESEPNMGEYETWPTGTPYAHSDYVDSWSGFPNTYDVGVVILDDPVEDMDVFGALPELGELDGLEVRRGHQDLVFRTVGYGDQSIKPRYQGDYVRYTATSLLVNLRSNNTGGFGLHTSNNPGKGHGTSGGACFGDSGGPIFYPEDSNQVVAVVSFGMNWNCKGADFAYRTDIADTQDFLDDYLP